MSPETILDIRNLRVSIPTDRGLLNAVRGVDLSLRTGETLCLVGESGCGKSLTATALMGLLPRHARQDADRFALMGQDYAGKPARAWSGLRGRELAMIFQDPMNSLNPTLTVGRQMTEGVVHSEGIDQSAAKQRAVDLLERVGIAHAKARLSQYPHQFSGGQRQRIMIAAALMGRPRLLIADEPTTALDVTIQAQILDLIRELQRDLDLGVLMITHDLGVVAAIATEVAVMYAGQIVERAPAANLYGNPQHPYTQGLLAAIPVPGRTARGSHLAAIPGRVPGLIGKLDGCAFRDRCDRVMPACATGSVPASLVAPDHMGTCHHLVPAGARVSEGAQ
ncbi:ABC transporter ATP-binding protein [Mameliella alba]|nr:ABC transporter ATP-binding protein [Antarctobacter heliothermus]MBY6146569.1 ABC transporter ATP-binding protein [Mameliella alba]MCA0956289.1 ABC transporter ATP-binding protein [Mameliella alba]